MFASISQAVFYHAEKQPDKLCIADDKSSVTYRQYAEKIKRYAGCLLEMGIKADDRVVIEACQTIDYLAIAMALQIIGAVFVPVEHNCAPDKICSFAARTGAKAVISVKDADYGGHACCTFAKLLEMHEGSAPLSSWAFPKKDAVCEILFSTGTTGVEKGIMISSANNIALAENVMYGVRMEKDNVEMIPSPMNHSHGLRRYYANMYNGSSVILLSSVMNVKQFFENFEKYGVNSLDLVPAALSVLLRLTKNKLADYKDVIRYTQLGSAPLMQADKDLICELLPSTRLYNFYGSTESGCTCIYDFNQKSSKQNCIGSPTRNTSVIIVDENRAAIDSTAENTGCIATVGGMNMVGYWQDEAETAKVMADGVVYSNDVGYVDDDGEIILLGRKGDVINVGGNKVSPEEIENAAKQMPEIADCGCVPVPDAAKGSVPKLFVQMKPGSAFDPVAVAGFLSKKLEAYKVPAIIVQIDKIPRSFNGKLLRKDLK